MAGATYKRNGTSELTGFVMRASEYSSRPFCPLLVDVILNEASLSSGRCALGTSTLSLAEQREAACCRGRASR